MTWVESAWQAILFAGLAGVLLVFMCGIVALILNLLYTIRGMALLIVLMVVMLTIKFKAEKEREMAEKKITFQGRLN